MLITCADKCAFRGLLTLLAVFVFYTMYLQELGDLVSQVDTAMALSIYLRANVPDKVVACFVQRGEFDQVHATHVDSYCQLKSVT